MGRTNAFGYRNGLNEEMVRERFEMAIVAARLHAWPHRPQIESALWKSIIGAKRFDETAGFGITQHPTCRQPNR